MIADVLTDVREHAPACVALLLVTLIRTAALTALMAAVTVLALIFAVACLAVTGRFPWFVRKWF